MSLASTLEDISTYAFMLWVVAGFLSLAFGGDNPCLPGPSFATPTPNHKPTTNPSTKPTTKPTR